MKKLTETSKKRAGVLRDPGSFGAGIVALPRSARPGAMGRSMQPIWSLRTMTCLCGDATLCTSSERAHVLKGEIGQAYEAFFELPVAVVLAVLWMFGAVLLAAGALALYLYVGLLVCV